MFKKSLRDRFYSSMNHQEYLDNVDPMTPILSFKRPKQAPNLMCIPEIELPPPQLSKKITSHFRNNSNPDQLQDDDLIQIKNDFTPICHLKTEFYLKMSMKPEPTTYNESYINFNQLENMATQYSPDKSKNFQEMENVKEFHVDDCSKSFQILNFASQIKDRQKVMSMREAQSVQQLDWLLE